MKQNRFLLIPLIFWEIIRFIFIYLFIISIFSNVLKVRLEPVYWLLSFGSCSLLVFFGLIVIVFKDYKSFILVNFLILGKILQLAPFIFMVSIMILKGPIAFIKNQGTLNIIIIIVFDLIFLVLLISYKVRGRSELLSEIKEPDSLPEFSGVSIKDISEK